MGKKTSLNRRRFLRSAGAGLTFAATSGIAGAQQTKTASSEVGGSSPFVIKDGKLDLLVTNRDGGKLNAQDVLQQVNTRRSGLTKGAIQSIRGGEPITGWDAAAMLAESVEKLNQAEQEGLVKIKEVENNVSVVLTEKSIKQYTKQAESGLSTMCGVTKYDLRWPKPFQLKPYIKQSLYTSDSDTELLKTRLVQGSVTAAAIAGILGTSTFGTGAPAIIFCTILSAGAAIYAAELGYQNNGCGCISVVKYLPIPGTPPIYKLTFDVYVTSQ